MCFNAEASFLGAAVAGGVGVAALTQVRQRRELLWAALPLAFAAHQLLEGLTWLAVDGRPRANLDGLSVRLWVLYAWALLPLWVPLGARALEPDERRRRWMLPFVVLGAADLAYMGFLALQPTVQVVVTDGDLDYLLPVDHGAFMLTPYVVTTCVTPLLSSYRWVRAFAAANLVALSASTVLEAKDFTSVWCLFAAVLSFLVLVHLRAQRRLELGAPAGAAAPA